MSADDTDVNTTTNEKKIRFRSGAKVLFSPDSKVEDLSENGKPEVSAEPFKRG